MELEAEIAKIDAGRLVNLSRMGNKYPALYFFCISIVFLLYLCLVFVYCVIFVLTCPDWESNILRGSLYFYCISVVFLQHLEECLECLQG